MEEHWVIIDSDDYMKYGPSDDEEWLSDRFKNAFLYEINEIIIKVIKYFERIVRAQNLKISWDLDDGAPV